MKLEYLEIREKLSLSTTPELEGTVTFIGTIGKMTIPLTQQDIEDIEQLLRNKTKQLAAEA